MAVTAFICTLTLLILLLPVFLIIKNRKANTGLMLTLYVFILVLISRIGVGLMGQKQLGNDLSVWETVFDSMVHTLQTFSMDEDYTLYTNTGKELLEEAGSHQGAVAYGFVISILNFCAPILGGALLLEILADVFPYLKLYLHPFCSKCVFSELNDESITLAEELAVADSSKELKGLYSGRKKPLLVFTDAYPDKTSEPRTELFERAKAISAVCVKTDLLHIPFRASQSVSYFLIDRKIQDNITAFSRLLAKDARSRWLWPVSGETEEPVTRIYIFTKTDTDNDMIWRACESMGKELSKVLVRPIRDYMNTCINQMFDVPLFVPLLGRQKDGDRDLFLTILGSGAFAEESFKAAFWCGQIQGVQLHIDVLAENVDELKRRIIEGCPELLESCQFEPDEVSGTNPAACGEDTAYHQNAGNSILTVDPADPQAPSNPPYCILHFRKVEDASSWSCWPAEILDRTDYYIVALGDDTRNVETAEKIRMQLIRRFAVKGKASDGESHKVIAPVVFDEDMTDLIRKADPGEGEPYMMPFAHLKSRYSCRNILMDAFVLTAEEDAKLYDAVSQGKLQEDEYSHWANLSRAVHYPYKLFGLGIVVGFCPDQTGRDRFAVQSPYKVTEHENEELAWSEHRRWNAFLRTQGFSCPSKEQFESYYRRHCDNGETDLYKDVSLKFHPCLVERGMWHRQVPGKCLEKGTIPKGFDRLDLLSAAHHKDYKMYDYKEYDADLMMYLQ